MWDKLNTAAHNSLCGYSQSKWSVLLHPRFPKVTPAFQRGYLPSSSTEPQAVWGWMADLKQSTGLPGYSLHSISTTSTLFLESTSSLMRKQIPWGRGCRELLRAVQGSAGARPCHNASCPYLLLLLLGTLPMGRKSQDAFLPERRKQCWQVRWFPWSSLRHCSRSPLLHPEAQGKHCCLSLINKPRAKLLKSFDSCSRGSEEQQWHSTVL